MNLHELWTAWPDREVSGVMKGYMLAQLAFWLQQILVINIEERRKDHWQMFTHHIITISLIYASYRYHHTRIGNLILVLMDVVDLFLPVRGPRLGMHVFLLAYRRATARQVPQIPWLHHPVRLHVWRLHGLVVHCAPCLVRRGLLFGVGPLARYLAKRLLYGIQ
jgi:hypothetical protein